MEQAPLKAFGQEYVLTKKDYKPYLKRSNKHGLIRFGVHMGLIAVAAGLVSVTLGTWWIVPVMAVYAILLAFLFAPVHECSHGTTFRNRRLNEVIFWIVCLIYMVPPTFFRYAHATHHTYTQIRGWDPDMLPERMTASAYIKFVLGFTFWQRNIKWFLFHPFGKIDPTQRYFLPQSEIPRVVREARIIFMIYAGIAGVSIVFNPWIPLIYWVIPRLVGEPFMRWMRISEHGECEENGDLRENTRTTYTSGIIRYLFWEMPYHAEHHLCPMVPFHALGRLHEKFGHKLHAVGDGYMSINKDVYVKAKQKQGVTWDNPTSSVHQPVSQEFS